MGRGSFRRFDFREERVRNFAIGWSGEEGERKGKENLSVVVFFSRSRISVTENTGDHRSAWFGTVQKVPGEKPRTGRNETVVEN